MRDPHDPRPDDVYFYTLGQADGDRVVEGYNERDDDAETSGDLTHLWHRHDSYRRNIIGSYWHMWQALTIDMGWTVAEWRQSLEDGMELTDKVRYNVGGDVNYTSEETTVAGMLASTNYYVLQGRNQLLGELRAAALRDQAILTAVAGVDEEAVLAAVHARADQLDAAQAALAANLLALPGAVRAELEEAGGGTVDGAAVQASVERALQKLQLTVAA
jgi:hypothetical protein